MGKSIKHHLANFKSGKCNCGIDFHKNSIRLAELDDDNKWYNDFGNELDVESNWESVFCMTCLRLHETNLIEQFKLNTFLIQYELALPKTNRLRKIKKATVKRNRIANPKIKSIKTNKPIESKSKRNPIPKSKKGIERDKKKQANSLKQTKPIDKPTESKPIDKPTESKCKIIAKPDKPIDKPIDLVNEIKPLIDLSNGPVTIETFEEVIETIDPNEEWSIGDPIDDDTIFELSIGSDWKLVRHNKQLDKWQFQSKQVVKGLPKWIADSEWIDYKDASELIIDGYCE